MASSFLFLSSDIKGHAHSILRLTCRLVRLSSACQMGQVASFQMIHQGQASSGSPALCLAGQETQRVGISYFSPPESQSPPGATHSHMTNGVPWQDRMWPNAQRGAEALRDKECQEQESSLRLVVREHLQGWQG